MLAISRAIQELKRRGRVVQAFLSRKSLMRILGAVFSEMGEDWMARRRLAEDAIALAASPT